MSTRRQSRIISPTKTRFPGSYGSPLPSPNSTYQTASYTTPSAPSHDAARLHAQALLRPLHSHELEALHSQHAQQTEELKVLMLPIVRKHADFLMNRYRREQRAEVEKLQATVVQSRKVQQETGVLNDFLALFGLVVSVVAVILIVVMLS